MLSFFQETLKWAWCDVCMALISDPSLLGKIEKVLLLSQCQWISHKVRGRMCYYNVRILYECPRHVIYFTEGASVSMKGKERSFVLQKSLTLVDLLLSSWLRREWWMEKIIWIYYDPDKEDGERSHTHIEAKMNVKEYHGYKYGTSIFIIIKATTLHLVT